MVRGRTRFHGAVLGEGPVLEGLRIQLLGPVRLYAGAEPVRIGGPGVRGLLAILALDPNRIVALDDLIDALWNHDPPRTARTIVHGNVSQLRRVLRSFDPPQAGIDTASPGYRLVIDPDLVDVHRARALFERAESAPLAQRADLLAEAHSLWQGPELGGVPEPVRAPELTDLRIAVHGARVDADLALGRHAELITELTTIVRDDPRRERTVGQLMRALYYSGRRADALELYRVAARYASENLGLDPGPDLRALHEDVLNDALAPAAAGIDMTRVVPRQLPPAVPVLAGRSADLAWLDSLDGVGVITGPPGIGKSALAVWWAHRAASRFPDGVLFAALRGFDAPVAVAEVLTQFLLGLGVPPGELPESEGERLALYRSLIGGRRVLVVLDDARSAGQVRPLLPPGAGSLAVVTSRARLDGLTVSHGARVRPLEPLARRDAVRLVADVAGGSFAEHHEQVARLCGDLPLALRIAGARLAAGPAWTVPEFVVELASERTRLAALDVDDAGVRAALDVSFRGLPPEVASTFRALGAFPGPTVGPFVAAALCEVPVAEARRRLRVLAAHHLLTETGPDVFTQHDLVRLYQRELAGSSSGAVLARAVRYYQAAADFARRRLLRIVDPLDFSGGSFELPALDGFDVALAWFVAEWPNQLAVLAAAGSAGLHDDVWRLARVVHTYRVVRPLWDEWQRLVSLGMTAAEACGDPEARFWMLISRCAMSLTFDLGAASFADASGALSIAGADSGRRICAMIHLGCAMNSCGRHAEAIAVLVEATFLAGDDELRGQALANCAEAEKAAGRYDEAIAHQLESLEIDRRLGDESYVVVSLNNLAESYLRLGDDALALKYASEAVELASRRGFLLQEAVGRLSLGRVLRRRGDAEGARVQLGLAAELHQRVSPEPAAEVLAELEALGEPDAPADAVELRVPPRSADS